MQIIIFIKIPNKMTSLNIFMNYLISAYSINNSYLARRRRAKK